MAGWDEHRFSPNLGGAAAGPAVPAVDYLDWYLEELAADRPYDLSQSGFAHPWDIEALTDDGGLSESLLKPDHSRLGDPRIMVADREGCEPDAVVCGHGALQMLGLALLAVLPDPSVSLTEVERLRARTVAVEMPAFAPVAQVARLLGCQVLPFQRGPSGPTDAGPWRLDRQTLGDLLGRVSAVMLTPMQNPSGHMLDADDQRWLIEATGEAGVGIVSDEVYIDAARGSPDHSPMWRLCGHAISVNSLTKCYGLGPIRFGWGIGQPEHALRMRNGLHNIQGMLATPSLRIAALVWPRLDEALHRMQMHRQVNLPILRAVLEGRVDDWRPPPHGVFGCIRMPNGWPAAQALSLHGESLGLLATPCVMFDESLTGWLRIAWGDEPAAFAASAEVLGEFLDILSRLEH